ncbi:hypothetical protein OEB99_16550 [Actinotalea sp. M2MS4P-6]|uniref:hypothetical protein n=1 Tax=Actinotalea sp. M2MS4P-6 TaxID=2983762 RepID=UPI0021E36172|nr:hypothetical protein [Actinotalea sp. M2MS4P-6]MCV2395927.1 hypothetical protein [Actinotalea sp. M2MS4P-6]
MIDYATATGQVRLLIADVDETAPLLDDDAVNGYLALNGVTDPTDTSDKAATRRAAADALDAIASSESLISKKIRTQAGVSTDGPAVAADLRKHAAQLRAQAEEYDDGGFFETVEFQPYPTVG